MASERAGQDSAPITEPALIEPFENVFHAEFISCDDADASWSTTVEEGGGVVGAPAASLALTSAGESEAAVLRGERSDTCGGGTVDAAGVPPVRDGAEGDAAAAGAGASSDSPRTTWDHGEERLRGFRGNGGAWLLE